MNNTAMINTAMNIAAKDKIDFKKLNSHGIKTKAEQTPKTYIFNNAKELKH